MQKNKTLYSSFLQITQDWMSYYKLVRKENILLFEHFACTKIHLWQLRWLIIPLVSDQFWQFLQIMLGHFMYKPLIDLVTPSSYFSWKPLSPGEKNVVQLWKLPSIMQKEKKKNVFSIIINTVMSASWTTHLSDCHCGTYSCFRHRQ